MGFCGSFAGDDNAGRSDDDLDGVACAIADVFKLSRFDFSVGRGEVILLVEAFKKRTSRSLDNSAGESVDLGVDS